jgi:hypothetical protein
MCPGKKGKLHAVMGNSADIVHVYIDLNVGYLLLLDLVEGGSIDSRRVS